MQPVLQAREGAPVGQGHFLRGLDFLWLELTGKCNLACVHCYADSGPFLPLMEGMQLDDWRRVLAESYDLGCRKVQFIGGEPTIYPGLVELIDHAKTLGYELIEVYTNGTRFTEKIKAGFETYAVHLAFSVYADEAPIHDSITLRTGSFVKTVKNIKWALSQGLGVRVAIVEMSQNASAVERTKTLFEKLGVAEVTAHPIQGVGRGSAGREVASPIDELCGHCWQGKLCVTPNGTMFPCVFSRSWQVGNVAQGVKAVVEGEPLLDFRSTLRSHLEAKTPQVCNPGAEKACAPDIPACAPDEKACLPVPAACAPEGQKACPPSAPAACAPEGQKAKSWVH
jgi:MoaA/NifB/PqqE/SkfB family radical SAM enzyme